MLYLVVFSVLREIREISWFISHIEFRSRDTPKKPFIEHIEYLCFSKLVND